MSLSAEHLQDVARMRDSDGRRELLGAVADMFLAGDTNKSSREAALFSDIFLRTVGDLDRDGQVELSNQLASSAETPKSVALHLARAEDANVADPILRLSPVLEEVDLIKIAKELSNDHLVSISQRETLSENITDVLIDRGCDKVMQHVSANDGAQISRTGFDTLAKHAENDAVLQENLAERMDCPEDVMRRVLPKVSNDVAARVKKAFASAVDKDAMSNALAKAESAFAGAKLDSSRSRVACLVFAKDISEGRKNLDDVVIDLCRQDKFLELVTIIGRLANLPDGMVGDMMFKTQNAPFIIIARSLGMSKKAFSDLSELRCARLKLPSSHGAHAMAEFEQISDTLGKRLMRFVNLRMAV